jgi:hypothetical protein
MKTTKKISFVNKKSKSKKKPEMIFPQRSISDKKISGKNRIYTQQKLLYVIYPIQHLIRLLISNIYTQ